MSKGYGDAWTEEETNILLNYYPTYKAVGVAAILEYIGKRRSVGSVRAKAKRGMENAERLIDAKKLIANSIERKGYADLLDLMTEHGVETGALREAARILTAEGYPIEKDLDEPWLYIKREERTNAF